MRCNIYVADRNILRFDPWGIPSVFADVPYANSIAVDGQGNVYACVSYPGIIYKLTATGERSIIAGSESDGGFGGDESPATEARFNWLGGIVADSAGNV